MSEPRLRKFAPTIGHVLPPKHAESEHFSRSQIRFEFRMKIFANRFGTDIGVTGLHPIIDGDTSFHKKICVPGAGKAKADGQRNIVPIRSEGDMPLVTWQR